MRKLYLLFLTIITICCIVVGAMINLAGDFSLLDIGSVLYFGDDDDERSRGGEELNMEGTQEFESFDNLVIEVGVADLTIKKSDRNAITTNINKEKLAPRTRLKGDTLTVSQKSKEAKKFSMSDLGSNTKCEILIEVDGNLDSLDIELGVGTLNLDGINSDDIDIEHGVGDTNVADVSFKNCDIENGTGNVTMTGLSEPADYDMDFEVGVGKIRVDGNEVSNNYESGGSNKSIDIETGVGDVAVDFK